MKTSSTIRCPACKAVGAWADGWAMDCRAQYRCKACKQRWTYGADGEPKDTAERRQLSRIGLMLYRRQVWRGEWRPSAEESWQLVDATPDEVDRVKELATKLGTTMPYDHGKWISCIPEEKHGKK